jgi:hypothetical protein
MATRSERIKSPARFLIGVGMSRNEFKNAAKELLLSLPLKRAIARMRRSREFALPVAGEVALAAE